LIAPHRLILPLLTMLAVALLSAACGLGGGSDSPKATATPSRPSAEDAIGKWVAENRSVGFIPNCPDAKPGVDVGKLCATLLGERGKRRAYALGPTFSEATALAFVEDAADGWTVLSVTNRDPSRPQVPGIDWPLEVGDGVVMVGLGEGECLSIREQPTQQAKRVDCKLDGTQAIIQEGPVMAETITWWRIAGEGFNGWAAGTWLRLPEAIAQALNPPTPTPASQ
jgi:hypothetical protein